MSQRIALTPSIAIYRIIQPVLVGIFGAVVFGLKVLSFIPAVRESTAKLRETWNIRKKNHQSGFLAIDPELFRGKQPIWIHAASGEFEYAKPVVRELAKQGIPVFVTYFSPTYRLNVERFPGVTASCALPLESPKELRKMISHVRPRALLISRTDTWLNMIFESKRAGIPVLLFSTTFHAGSKRVNPLTLALTRDTFHLIDEVQCVAEDDRKFLSSIGIDRVEVRGDTRYDQVLARLENPKELPMGLRESVRDLAFVAGSAWMEDLDSLLSASSQTRANYPHTLIVVPHESSSAIRARLEKEARERNLKFGILSRGLDGTQYDVVYADVVGVLAEIYLLAQVAFVGGSFRKTVHSVMEPLAAGCLTIVGPFHTNNREAIEFQSLKLRGHSNISLVTGAADAGEFARILSSCFEAVASGDERTNLKEEIRLRIRERLGATQAVLAWLKATLPSSGDRQT